MTIHTPSSGFDKLIYIAGYGRSGSTLLDVLLSNTKETIGTGEFTRLFEVANEGWPCSCMEHLEEACPLWSPVLDRVEVHLGGVDYQKANATTRRQERLWPALPNQTPQYRQIWKTALTALQEETACETVVDSSKLSRATAHRIEELTSMVEDVRVIHLVRDPRAVLWSIHRDFRRAGEHPYKPKSLGAQARTLGGWLLANRLTEKMVDDVDVPALRIRYEDLAREPLATMRQVCEFCEMDIDPLEEILTKGLPIDPGHGVRGGRMRLSGPIKIRYDDEWKEKIPLALEGLATITWPLSRRYGYHSASERP